MKKFIFMNFGMNNFDPAWWDYRFALFETFTLRSLENNATPGLYVLIFTNKYTPIEQKLRMKEIISKSPISKNIYIEEILVRREASELANNFVADHIISNEMHVRGRLDSDDIIAPGFFEYLESYILKKNIKNSFLTFQNIYDVMIERRSLYSRNYPWMPFNTWVVLSGIVEDFKHSTPHKKMSEYAEELGYTSEIITTETPMFGYVVHNISNESIVGSRHKDGWLLSSGRSYVGELSEGFLGIDAESIDRFYNENISPETMERLIRNHFFSSIAIDKDRSMHERLLYEQMYIESINAFDLKKELVYRELGKRYQVDKDWILSISRFNGFVYAPDDDLRKISDANTYVNTLTDRALMENIVILIASEGGDIDLLQPLFDFVKLKYPDIGLVTNASNFSLLLANNDQFMVSATGKRSHVKSQFSQDGKDRRHGLSLEVISADNCGFIQIDNLPVSLNNEGINICVYSFGSESILDIVSISAEKNLTRTPLRLKRTYQHYEHEQSRINDLIEQLKLMTSRNKFEQVKNKNKDMQHKALISNYNRRRRKSKSEINELSKQYNLAIKENDKLKLEAEKQKQEIEKLRQETKKLCNTMESIYKSHSWRLGHGIVKFFSRFSLTRRSK